MTREELAREIANLLRARPDVASQYAVALAILDRLEAAGVALPPPVSTWRKPGNDEIGA